MTAASLHRDGKQRRTEQSENEREKERGYGVHSRNDCCADGKAFPVRRACVGAAICRIIRPFLIPFPSERFEGNKLGTCVRVHARFACFINTRSRRAAVRFQRQSREMQTDPGNIGVV